MAETARGHATATFSMTHFCNCAGKIDARRVTRSMRALSVRDLLNPP